MRRGASVTRVMQAATTPSCRQAGNASMFPGRQRARGVAEAACVVEEREEELGHDTVKLLRWRESKPFPGKARNERAGTSKNQSDPLLAGLKGYYEREGWVR